MNNSNKNIYTFINVNLPYKIMILLKTFLVVKYEYVVFLINKYFITRITKMF